MKHTAILIAALLLTACGPKSSVGFRLPDGDANAGREAFTELRCSVCHTLPGADTDASSAYVVALGGEVSRVRTYGQLVTSIINPSHKIADPDINPTFLINGKSAMETARLNQTVTVEQLVDLVAYLQPLYEVRTPEFDPYNHVYP